MRIILDKIVATNYMHDLPKIRINTILHRLHNADNLFRASLTRANYHPCREDIYKAAITPAKPSATAAPAKPLALAALVVTCAGADAVLTVAFPSGTMPVAL